MADDRSAGSARPGTYTGVAGGSLGTAANLEDTQVYRLEDLQPPPPAAPPAPPPPPAPPARPAPTARPVAGGAIAAVLVAVIGGAILLAAADNSPNIGTGPGVDVPSAGATLRLATQPPNGGRDGGSGTNNGNGRGNGGGNGRGNGGGNGRGG